MKTSEANIEITRENGNISSISVIMPTWRSNIESEDFLTITIPLLGVKTIAKDDNDSEIAIEEAIKGFLIASEKFGQGFEKELETLGWISISRTDNHSLLNYSIENNFVLEQIMETGEQFAQNNLHLA